MISEKKLIEYNAAHIKIDKDIYLFKQGEQAKYYFQIIKGSVKMNNFNDDGKEFIQGIFYDGQSFGEPPLFDTFNYPANAVTLEKTELYKLPKDLFFKLLEENPKTTIGVTKSIAKRLHYKAIMAVEISSQEASHRILTLLDYLKENFHHQINLTETNLTRQQIADLTGLRVETVIRTLKKLEKEEKVKIINKKVWR